MTESENLRAKLRERTHERNAARQESSLLLSCLHQVFIEKLPPMEPRRVVRDEYGLYSSPLYPDLPEATTASLFQLWLEHQKLEALVLSMPEHHHGSATEGDDGFDAVRAWTPQPPEGDGWFLVRISESEHDGGFGAVWVRHTDEAKSQRWRDTTLISYFADEGKTFWSISNESFYRNSLHGLIKVNDQLKAGDVVYSSIVGIPDIESFTDARSVIEDISIAACDVAGEAAEDFPDYCDEDLASLEQLLKAWVHSVGHPTWWICQAPTPYTLTQADIDAARSTNE